MSTYIPQQHVPFVPLSVSVPLVDAAPLAAMLASSAPELLEVSKSQFEETRINELKQLEAEEVDSHALRGILDLYVLNMQALFAAITHQLQTRGQFSEKALEHDANASNLYSHSVKALAEVRQIAADLELPKALYTEDRPIEPAALFEACLLRLKYWQQKWQEHCFKAIELDLKSQRDMVLGAVADCLVTLCEEGVNNVISFDPTPQAQEDVYLSLYEAIEHPFGGAWIKIITVTPSTKADLTSQGESA